MSSTVGQGRKARADIIEVWECPRVSYPNSDVPDWETWGGGSSLDELPGSATIVTPPMAHVVSGEEFDRRLEEEGRRSFDAGRAQGLEQGGAAERAAQGPANERLAAQIEGMLASFVEERDRYLQKVEQEVVKLALAVAARILRREAQMDPLLLTGAVRVALGQLAASTRVRLHVPPAELDLWAEAIVHLPNLAVKPEVMPGDAMRLGDCTVETDLGTVDLGVRAQLSEIERGFFDRTASAASAPGAVLADLERTR